MLFYSVTFAAETQTYLAVKEWLLREELEMNDLLIFLHARHTLLRLFQRSLMNRMLMCTSKVIYSISQQIHKTFSQLNI